MDTNTQLLITNLLWIGTIVVMSYLLHYRCGT